MNALNVASNTALEIYNRCPDISGPIVEKGEVIAFSMAQQATHGLAFRVLGRFIGTGAARALKLTIFCVNPKTSDIASSILSGDYQSVIEELQDAKTEIWKSVVVYLNSSSQDLLSVQIKNACEKASLSAAGVLMNSVSNVGVVEMFYTAAMPVLAPSVPPVATSSMLAAFKLARYYSKKAELKKSEGEEEELISREWVVIDHSVQNEGWIVFCSSKAATCLKKMARGLYSIAK